MPDLLTMLRQHDLPPRWDGHPVVWTGWEYVKPIFMCSPKVEVCESCGQPTTDKGFPCWSQNHGYVADRPDLPHDDYEREETARARLPFLAKGKMPRHWWLELIAMRCHHCDTDTVWDTRTNTMWTLDHTDYNDEGSHA